MISASRVRGTLALVVTAALWGSNHVVARAARDIVPLPSLVFWRWGLAVMALTVIALPPLRQAWPAVRPKLFELMRGGAVGVGLFSYFLLGGAYQSLAIEVSFINATTPVWVLLISVCLRRNAPGDQLESAFTEGNARATSRAAMIVLMWIRTVSSTRRA